MVATNLRRVCILSGMAIVLISGVIGCRSGKLSNPFVRNQTVTTNTATPPTPPPGVAGTPVGDSSSFLGSGTTVGTTTMGTTTATPIVGGGTVVANGPVVTGGSNVSSGGSVPGSTASVMTPMPNPQNTTTTQATANPSLPTSGAVSSYRVPTDSVSPVSVALPASTMNTASSANGVTLENTMRGSSVTTSAGQSIATRESHLVGYSAGGSATFPSAASSAVSSASVPEATAGNDSGVWNVGNPQNVIDGTPVDNTYAGTASGSVQNSAMPTGQPLDPPIPSNPVSSTSSNITSSNSVANSNGSSGTNGVTSNNTASASANHVSAGGSPTSGTTTLYYPKETETNRAEENNSASTDPTTQPLATNGTTDMSDPRSTDIAIPEVLKQLGQTENLEWVTKSDGLHLIVSTDRLFASQTTDWTSDARPLAERIWKAIQTVASDTSTSTDLNLSAESKILIIGYTDSSQNVAELAGNGTSGAGIDASKTGSGTSDEESRRLSELSAKQASAMRDFAVTASSFAQDRFEILGRGDAEPRFSNGTEKGRAGNRRLEIILPQKNS